jgi:hypothetical protein
LEPLAKIAVFVILNEVKDLNLLGTLDSCYAQNDKGMAKEFCKSLFVKPEKAAT